MKAVQAGVDDNLVDLLAKLKAVSRETWKTYKQESHEALFAYERERDMKRMRSSSRAEKKTYGRAPKTINATRARNR